jgi:putative restriction endonuclease
MYDFRCQICDVRLETAAGPYAEGAHLVPLGGGQQGVDHVSNVLCLCPNHHVLLDHGAIAFSDTWEVIDRTGLVVGQLTVDPLHLLDVAYARHHRKLFGFGG